MKLQVDSNCSRLKIDVVVNLSKHEYESGREGEKFARPKWRQRQHKLKLIIKSVLMIILLPHLCQSALLTNIYGKKLSELTDFANRFLIVASPTNDPLQQASDSGNLIDNEDVAQFSANPLMAAWKINQQQQPQQPPLLAPLSSSDGPPITSKQTKFFNGGRLATIDIKNNNVESNSTSTSSALSFDSNRVPGEPVVLDSVSTEFPNPNINNLGHEITKILKKFFLHGYDKRVRPNYSGPPALVSISFHIIGISSVDEVQMDFTTDFYFRQKWYDPRLVFDPVGGVDELCVGAEFAEKIWLPDTFFANEKTATFHKATTENTFIRIGHDGRVYRSIRLTVTCSCPMDLQYFPMDRQRCKIEIESYGYNTRDIDYRWERGDNSVTLETKIELPQFKILGFKMGQEIQNLSSGDYIRLYCEIHFVRSMGYYLIQIYIPASLIVMISWVSFWLHRNATPARVALGVTTVLTMTTLMSSTNAALPKISYIKSIDVFLGTCFVMVFASLLEYASVGYIGKRIAMKRKRLQDLQQMQQHHQRVCVAAAASAAAQASSNLTPSGGHLHHLSDDGPEGQSSFKESSLIVTPLQLNLDSRGQSDAQALQRRLNLASESGVKLNYKDEIDDQGLHRVRTLVNGSNSLNVDLTNYPTNCRQTKSANKQQPNLYSDSPNRSIGDPKKGNPRRRSKPISPSEATKTSLFAPAATAVAANQPSGNTASEFEVSQTHDMITICGLTPSAIDKHSRVVFPICFVCFNLMYWIIYGHISQQIEDKGPPLIPFIKA